MEQDRRQEQGRRSKNVIRESKGKAKINEIKCRRKVKILTGERRRTKV